MFVSKQALSKLNCQCHNSYVISGLQIGKAWVSFSRHFFKTASLIFLESKLRKKLQYGTMLYPVRAFFEVFKMGSRKIIKPCVIVLKTNNKGLRLLIKKQTN